MKSITTAQLEDLLRAVRHRTSCDMVTVTAPDMIKTDNPYYGRLTRRARRRCTLADSYEARVNAVRTAQGLPSDFTAKPRPWGVRVDGSPLIVHKGAHYVEVIVEELLDSSYDACGVPMAEELVRPFLRGTAPEHGITVRTFAINSIVELHMLGESYQVV